MRQPERFCVVDKLNGDRWTDGQTRSHRTGLPKLDDVQRKWSCCWPFTMRKLRWGKIGEKLQSRDMHHICYRPQPQFNNNGKHRFIIRQQDLSSQQDTRPIWFHLALLRKQTTEVNEQQHRRLRWIILRNPSSGRTCRQANMLASRNRSPQRDSILELIDQFPHT